MKGIKAGETSRSAQKPVWSHIHTVKDADVVLRQRRISQAFIHLSSLHFKQIYCEIESPGLRKLLT